MNRGIGLGIKMSSVNLYGLGERETESLELLTDGSLYEMWSFGKVHQPHTGTLEALYGNMPYIQGVA